MVETHAPYAWSFCTLPTSKDSARKDHESAEILKQSGLRTKLGIALHALWLS
jgi:hypothetical protein